MGAKFEGLKLAWDYRGELRCRRKWAGTIWGWVGDQWFVLNVWHVSPDILKNEIIYPKISVLKVSSGLFPFLFHKCKKIRLSVFKRSCQSHSFVSVGGLSTWIPSQGWMWSGHGMSSSILGWYPLDVRGPPTKLWQPSMSPDTVRCPPVGKITPAENHCFRRMEKGHASCFAEGIKLWF